jgi:archaellum component FlaC
MFDDKFFDDWLDTQAQKVMSLVAEGESISPDQMMILMLKAQTNHFAHLDVDLRNDMKLLREDMDKRFEQVDKRLEQVDKRFEQLTSRIDHFMVWSFATTLTMGGIVITVIKFL